MSDERDEQEAALERVAANQATAGRATMGVCGLVACEEPPTMVLWLGGLIGWGVSCEAHAVEAGLALMQLERRWVFMTRGVS